MAINEIFDISLTNIGLLLTILTAVAGLIIQFRNWRKEVRKQEQEQREKREAEQKRLHDTLGTINDNIKSVSTANNINKDDITNLKKALSEIKGDVHELITEGSPVALAKIEVINNKIADFERRLERLESERQSNNK